MCHVPSCPYTPETYSKNNAINKMLTLILINTSSPPHSFMKTPSKLISYPPILPNPTPVRTILRAAMQATVTPIYSTQPYPL